jgi:hypothetical protein
MSGDNPANIGVISNEMMIKFCQIAEIPDDQRLSFASELRDTVKRVGERNPQYKASDPLPSLIAAAGAVRSAALALLQVIECCDRTAKGMINDMLLQRSMNDRTDAVHDLWAASDSVVAALMMPNGRDSSKAGPPSKEIGSPGVRGGDLTAFNICCSVYKHGGRLTVNETPSVSASEKGLVKFFDLMHAFLPIGAGPPRSLSRLKDIRKKARDALRPQVNNRPQNHVE